MGHEARPFRDLFIDNANPALKRWATLGKALRACSLGEVPPCSRGEPALSEAEVEALAGVRARRACPERSRGEIPSVARELLEAALARPGRDATPPPARRATFVLAMPPHAAHSCRGPARPPRIRPGESALSEAEGALPNLAQRFNGAPGTPGFRFLGCSAG